ncbi:MAG TPA: thioredoxin family protein [Rhizomicrobium sp.]|nr:thioredoxin family protein [Rhizomicrobium sp.]
MIRIFTLAIAIGLATIGGAAAVPAPKLHIAALNELATPLPIPYNESANADADVAAAKARAQASGKLLLIDLGGNWCGDCRVLAGIMALPEMKTFMDTHYVMVAVDVGRFNRNLQVPAHYGITHRLEGVPSVLVVDPASDTLINAGHVAALADARSMTPQAIADWFAQWAR